MKKTCLKLVEKVLRFSGCFVEKHYFFTSLLPFYLSPNILIVITT